MHPSTSLGPSFRGIFAAGVPFYSVLLGDRVPVAFNVLVQGGVRVLSIGLLERNVVQAKFLGRFSYLEFVLSFEQTKKKSEQSKASVLACACLDIMQNAIICRKEANLEGEFWREEKNRTCAS